MIEDLEERLAYIGLERADLEQLAQLKTAFEEHADELVAAFYRQLLAFPQTRHLLREPAVRERLLEKQRAYLVSLANPVIDDDYVAERRRIGWTHERIGLEPRWYLGAYALYVSLLTPIVLDACDGRTAQAERLLVTLQRRIWLDSGLALEAYIEYSADDLERLNEELAAASRRLQDDYQAQRRQLSQTTQRARAAEELASIGTLVAGLAHEIGTPMGVIQGHAKLLEKAVTDDKARWRLTTIQEQVARISKIIQSLLNMARPKSSERVPVDLEALLENTLTFLTEKFSRRDVRVTRELEPTPSALADPERLQQLFLNLFLNGVDAMPEGGELRVTLRPESGGVGIEIGDSGVGIAKRDLERIFEPFYTSKAAGKGSGLGLTVVNGIVADHGGRVEVESEPGRGTTFHIWLPTGTAGADAPTSTVA